MLLRRYKNRHQEQQVKEPAVSSEEKALEDMTVEELKAYAEENGIDIGRASSQDGILKKIQEAAEEPSDETDESDQGESTEEGNTSEEETE